MCVLGTKKEDKKCSTSEEGTLFREQKSFIILALFPLLFCSQKEGSRSRRQRAESFFHLFFCASFSTHCSLFFLSLFSLFSLKQLVCVFAREFSPHLKLFGGGSSSNHHRNLSSHYKSKQQHAKRVLLSKRTEQKQNAHEAESERELLFDRL